VAEAVYRAKVLKSSIGDRRFAKVSDVKCVWPSNASRPASVMLLLLARSNRIGAFGKASEQVVMRLDIRPFQSAVIVLQVWAKEARLLSHTRPKPPATAGPELRKPCDCRESNRRRDTSTRHSSVIWQTAGKRSVIRCQQNRRSAVRSADGGTASVLPRCRIEQASALSACEGDLTRVGNRPL